MQVFFYVIALSKIDFFVSDVGEESRYSPHTYLFASIAFTLKNILSPLPSSHKSSFSLAFLFYFISLFVYPLYQFHTVLITVAYIRSWYPVKWSEVKSLSRVRLFVTPWTVAYQTPPSMGFSRQEYWSGLPFSFSRGASRPRDRTLVSCIAGRHLTIWATREASKL